MSENMQIGAIARDAAKLNSLIKSESGHDVRPYAADVSNSDAWRRHQRRQARHEIQRLQHDVRGAVTVRGLQLVAHSLEKIDHNLRSQYQEFLSAYVAIREALFTQDEIMCYIAVLRELRVQDYFAAMRNFRKQLREPLVEALRRMSERAVTGSGETPIAK